MLKDRCFLQLTDSIVRTEIHATEERRSLRCCPNCCSPPTTTPCATSFQNQQRWCKISRRETHGRGTWMKQSPCTITATQVSEIQSVPMQSSATRQPVSFPSHAFFPFSSAGHGFPVQGSRQAIRWWFETKKEPLPSSRKIPCKARLLCRLCGSLIAVGPGSYEILRRTIFFADCPSFLARNCLSPLSLSLSLSDVCMCVCAFYTKIFVQLPVS